MGGTLREESTAGTAKECRLVVKKNGGMKTTDWDVGR